MHFLHNINFRSLTFIKLLIVASAIMVVTFFPSSSQALSLTPSFEFSATPVSGNAPLTVGFNATNVLPDVSTYYVSFGDGTEAKMEMLACAGGCAHNPMTTSHTYASPGTYTARLLFSAPCSSGLNCTAVLTEAAMVTVTVTQGSGNADLYSVSPSSGEVPLTVTFSFVQSSPCSPYTLTWGDGSNSNYAGPPPNTACQAVIDYNAKATHTYTKAGTYTIRFQPQGMSAVTRTVTVREADRDYGFAASRRSGDAPLGVDFTAYMADEQSGEVDFGDGTSANMRVSSGGEKRTVSHTYNRPGTYTARLTVKSINPSWTTIEDDVASVRITVRGDDETDDRIKKLQKQIEELKAMLEKLLQLKGSGELSANVGCPLFTRVLARGMSDRETGGDITRLQLFLRSTGDYTYPEITGYFGVATEQAVQRWQARNGVVSSGTPDTTGYGVVGPKTQAAMARCGR